MHPKVSTRPKVAVTIGEWHYWSNMPTSAEQRASTISKFANEASEKLNGDIIILNWEISSPIDFMTFQLLNSRSLKENLYLIIVTEGGNADAAYRTIRAFQNNYQRITAVVPGWCKSAGTLMCVGAHCLEMGDMGELGPLDVQISKADELDERMSGLAVETAFEKLQQEAFKIFYRTVQDLGTTQYRITLKTASDIASRVTIGLVSPIFDKLDPVTIGEDYRSNRLAEAYAQRLDLKSRQLKKGGDFDALEVLLSRYPSHGFVIDREEASGLFRRVKPICDELIPLVDALGFDAVLPRSRSRDQPPKLEFLNDQPHADDEVERQADGDAATVDSGDGLPDSGSRAEDISRSSDGGSDAPSVDVKGSEDSASVQDGG